MVIAQYYPVISGVEIQAKRILEYLVKKGFSVSILTFRKNSPMKKFEIINNGVSSCRLKFIKIPKIYKYLLLKQESFWPFLRRENFKFLKMELRKIINNAQASLLI